MSETTEEQQRTGFEIAVIGMAGKFPGANTIHEFWENLKNGVESIAFVTPEDREETGTDPAQAQHPGYVGSRGGSLRDKDRFDAAFFDYTPGEATLMDPQMRVLHEVAWWALEDAGYDPGRYDGLIGFYAGESSTFFWEALSITSGTAEQTGSFLAIQFMDRSFLSTRISHRLNLRGPALTVQTACSTSLAAIHLASRALLSGECDMALAGGVSLGTIPPNGYIYQEGMILSPDGHCRAFDTTANGTVGGEGAGVVLLKPLEDAIQHKDYIYAVIKGTALNNDGNRKVGFSAPSIEGQADVIKSALLMAEVEPQSIRYIEAHGTGTGLGDPVEIEALKIAFNTSEVQFCGLGSVKTNIGHLDAAAGVTGFIKTALILKHRHVPPTLHYSAPNPKAGLENSPFYVVNRLLDWKDQPYPLRAGVSAFGIGGTNAHVIMEEWQDTPGPANGDALKIPDQSKNLHLILLSAQTATALEQTTRNLRECLKTHPGLNLADVAYTLQLGRKSCLHRRVLQGTTNDEISRILEIPASEKVRTFVPQKEDSPVAFMFPGQGAQYSNMGLELYKTHAVFREETDRCFEIIKSLLPIDLKSTLFPSCAAENTNINQTEIAQPLIFIIEYALARLLRSWGVKPAALLGHSIGEYTAACLAGVFSLEDALRVVVARGGLMQQQPPGAMLGVSISEQQLTPLLPAEIALAAVNSPTHCVVSGPLAAIDTFEAELKSKEIPTRRLHTSHAFHSAMMDSMLDHFRKEVNAIQLHKPKEPVLSNVTGYWLSDEQATDPGYWVQQVRQPVRFYDGITELLKKKITILIEAGPGNSLSTFVRQVNPESTTIQSVNLLRHPHEHTPDNRYFQEKLGQLWLYGVPIRWETGYPDGQPRRVPLPAYPFEGRNFKIDGNPFTLASQRPAGDLALARKPDIADWFYAPVWKQRLITTEPDKKQFTENRWLLFRDQAGISEVVAEYLTAQGAEVISINPGTRFVCESENLYTLNPAKEEDYDHLVKSVFKPGKPVKILHFWGVTPATEEGPETLWNRWEIAQEKGLFSIIFLAKALGNRDNSDAQSICVVTNGMQRVTGQELLFPEKVTVLGAIRVIAKENPRLTINSIDIELPAESPDKAGSKIHKHNLDALCRRLAQQVIHPQPVRETALRGTIFWQQEMEALRLGPETKESAGLKHQGVYLITGGLGGIGLETALYLAKTCKARLILIGRSEFPSTDQWQIYLSTHGPEDELSRKIRRLMEIDAMGSEVMVCGADVADYEQMKTVVSQAEARFGKINGIIHSAGKADFGGIIQRRSRESIESVLSAKLNGTLVLARLKPLDSLDFFVLCSSLASILAPFGEAGYIAANAFLDAYSHYSAGLEPQSTLRVTSVNWTSWLETGMAVESLKKASPHQPVQLSEGISSAEGVEALHRILGTNLPQIAVMTRDLKKILEQIAAQRYDPANLAEAREKKYKPSALRQRPVLSHPYTPPSGKEEEIVAEIWQDFFGIETIGVNDDFFELGGDSLRATALLAKIHKETNVSIPIATFFNYATIKGLVQNCFAPEENGTENQYMSIEPVEEREYFELSPAQERLFVMHQMQPDRPLYNMPDAMILDGGMNLDRMNRIFNRLIHRHESLRTSFEVIGTLPRQRVHHEVSFSIERYDLKSTGNGNPGTQPELEILHRFIRPFDLTRPPLLRVGLSNTGPNRNLLMIDLHHIVADGTSVTILLNEFLQLYHGEDIGHPRLQYRDFAHWQNRRFRAGEFKQMEQYWLKEFETPSPPLRLPLDNPRPQHYSFAGESVEVDLGEEMARQIREIARDENVTVFVFLLTVYTVFLAKISGQEDIVVGTVAAGRTHADLETMIGMFVNTLAIRNFPKAQMPFKTVLQEVKKRTLEAFDNQEYPFDDLVEQLHIQRETNRSPLFDVMFSYFSHKPALDPVSTETVGEEPLTATHYPFEYQESKFDLILGVVETEQAMQFTIQYSTILFNPSRIEKFMNYIRHILTVVIANPSLPVKDIILTHQLKTLDMDAYKQSDSEFSF